MNVLLKIWLEKLTSPSGLMLLVNQNHFMKIYKQCFVSSHYRALYYQAIVQALDQTNTGSKIDEEICYLCYDIGKWMGILVSWIRRINQKPHLWHLLCTG